MFLQAEEAPSWASASAETGKEPSHAGKPLTRFSQLPSPGPVRAAAGCAKCAIHPVSSRMAGWTEAHRHGGGWRWPLAIWPQGLVCPQGGERGCSETADNRGDRASPFCVTLAGSQEPLRPGEGWEDQALQLLTWLHP